MSRQPPATPSVPRRPRKSPGLVSDSRIKVLLVIYSLALGGAERAFVDLCTGLDAAIFDVRVFVIRDGVLRAVLERANIPIVVSEYRRPNLLTPLRELLALMRVFRPDVVHAHLTPVDMVARTAALLRRVPIIVSTQHDVFVWPLWLRYYRRASTRLIDAVVAGSPVIAEYCRRDIGVPESRLVLIENGVDAQAFGSGSSVRHSPAVFLCVGSLNRFKGHRLLLQAFAQVLRETDARLLLVGDGDDRENLERMSHSLGVAEVVEFRRPTEDVVGLLRESDIFVQPRVFASVGIAAKEAMAAAKPVLLGAEPDLRVSVPESFPGVVVAAGNESDLVDAMLKLIQQPGFAEDLGQRGAAWVSSQHSTVGVALRHAELYTRLRAERECTFPG